jgi:3-oxoadipate enol-lactonase
MVTYDDEGTGQAVVLVHGHPFNRSMWRPQVERFSRTCRMIAPDLRGYGENTAGISSVTTLDVFAQDIANLLDHLQLDKVVLGGLSMGGQIVMEFHRLFPERVRGLLLADTSPAAETPEGRRARNNTADRILSDGIHWYAEELLWKMLSPHSKHAEGHVRAMMRNTSPEGAAAALRGRAERPDYADMLRTVKVPALVVVGRQDEYTPVSEAERMRDLIPGAELVVIEGAAHMPNLERQTEFDEAFQRFLDTVG